MKNVKEMNEEAQRITLEYILLTDLLIDLSEFMGKLSPELASVFNAAIFPFIVRNTMRLEDVSDSDSINALFDEIKAELSDPEAPHWKPEEIFNLDKETK